MADCATRLCSDFLGQGPIYELRISPAKLGNPSQFKLVRLLTGNHKLTNLTLSMIGLLVFVV